MYSSKRRRVKTGVQILLIITVINLALATPIGVREISEVRFDVVSQKRWEPWDQSSKNTPDWKNVPPSPGWSDVENWTNEEPEPQNSRSSTGSNSESSNLTPSKRPHPESSGDFLPQGSSLIDDSPPLLSTKWSLGEYSPTWSTDRYDPSWATTKGSSDEYSPSWTKGSTEEQSSSWTKGSAGEHSPSWSEGSTEWSSNEHSPSWSEGSTEWSSNEYSPSWTKGSTDMYVPLSSSTKVSPAEYSPSWAKGSTDKSSTKWSSDEHSSSRTKWSTEENSPSSTKGWTEYSSSRTKWSTDKSSSVGSSTSGSHPPNPGLTEGRPLPEPSNPGPSTGACQSTNDYLPPNPELQHPVAPEPEDLLGMLLKGKFHIPRRVSGSGAVRGR